jgi:hypothetical protein
VGELKVQKVLDFIRDTLDLYPLPAAIYTWPDADLVGRNRASELYITGHLGVEEHDRNDVAALLEFADIRGHLEAGATHMRRHDGMVLIASKVEPFPASPRPTLVLGTLHKGVDDATAQMDHQRMHLLLRINESHEGALQMMLAVRMQLDALTDAQRDVTALTNAHMRSVMKEHYGK